MLPETDISCPSVLFIFVVFIFAQLILCLPEQVVGPS